MYSTASRTAVSDGIRAQIWGLDDFAVGAGHRTAWGDLYALSTGDGPQMRPTHGGIYISLIDRPRPMALSVVGRWTHDQRARPALGRPPKAAPMRPVHPLARADDVAAVRRGVTVAAREATAAVR